MKYTIFRLLSLQNQIYTAIFVGNKAIFNFQILNIMANSQFDDTGRAGTLLFYGAIAFILLVMLINYVYSLNMDSVPV